MPRGLHKPLFSLATAALLLISTVASSGTLTAIQDPNILPTIGDPADRYLSPAQEKALGAQFFRGQFNAGVVLQDPEVAEYIQYLGNSMTPQLGNNDHEFTFFVVNSNQINAFAVPGGYIGINTGLILESRNENELAGVLAHEIAHVSQRHLARRLAEQSKQTIPSLAALLGGIIAMSRGNSEAGMAILYGGLAANAQTILSFTRSNEIEADRIGLDILYKSKFDPNGMAGFFEVLQRKRLTPASKQFEFLSTHPLDNTRISEAKSRIDNLPVQRRQDSLDYQIIKARLRALSSNNSRGLVRRLDKELPASKKRSNIQHYAYSMALMRDNQHSKAAALLEKIVKKAPENSHYQLALAQAYQQIGKDKKSESALKKMITIYPDDYSATMQYADLLKKNKRSAPCRDLLKNYLQTHDTVPTTLIFKTLAECHSDVGEAVDSKQTLAYYYFTNGNYPAAISQLRDILRRQDLDFITRSQIESQLKAIASAFPNQG